MQTDLITATCTPACQNDGKCISYNVCQCDKEHRGRQCQYRVDACTPKKMNFNGSYNCSGDNEFLRCKLRCPENVNFLTQPADEYVCEFANGVFTPAIVPQCNYSECVLEVFALTFPVQIQAIPITYLSNL